jgi:hypothetical protein
MKPIRLSCVREARGRRGAALLAISVLLLVLAIMLAAFFRMNAAAFGEQRQYRENERAFYVAEAGLSEGYLEVTRGNFGSIGSEAAPSGLGNAEYWVDMENLGTRTYSLKSTGLDSIARERLELVMREIPDGFFRYAVFGAEGVVLRPESFVDSYDSELGSYAAQYDSSAGYADENGNVGSNEDITMQTNSEIHGNATPGPDGIVDLSAPNSYVSGSTEPAKELIELPPIQVPSIPSAGPWSLKKSSATLPAGDYHYSSLDLSSGASLTINGPARVVVDNFVLRSNTTLTVDTSTGPVEIYATGNLQLESNSNLVTNSERPRDMAFYISADDVNTKPTPIIDFSAQSNYIGLIYAPSAEVSFSANFAVYGSVMGREVSMGANSAVHYDSSLLFDDTNGPPEFETLLWRPVARQ